MNITELINELNKAKDKYGDIIVEIHQYDRDLSFDILGLKYEEGHYFKDKKDRLIIE